MANIISNSNFVALAGYYGNIRKTLGNVSGYLYSAVSLVAGISDVLPTYDLFDNFYNTYTVNSSSYVSMLPLAPAVRSLNAHILNRGGYADMDAYLTANSLTVPQSWADLSASVGQTIDPSLISG